MTSYSPSGDQSNGSPISLLLADLQGYKLHHLNSTYIDHLLRQGRRSHKSALCQQVRIYEYNGLNTRDFVSDDSVGLHCLPALLQRYVLCRFIIHNNNASYSREATSCSVSLNIAKSVKFT